MWGFCQNQKVFFRVFLAKIMNWSSPQRGDEGYNLSVAQLAATEALAGRRIFDPGCIFQLTCNLS
ncbi:hypothetical protein [Pseudomonas sp. NPDC087614]|uniref:hypothetical protein n=1 Tax=Pseudomonas sp. NPDC087614 TaxID=3364442 RepID=UPI003828C068